MAVVEVFVGAFHDFVTAVHRVPRTIRAVIRIAMQNCDTPSHETASHHPVAAHESVSLTASYNENDAHPTEFLERFLPRVTAFGYQNVVACHIECRIACRISWHNQDAASD